MTDVLSVTRLSKTFPGVRALDGVDFTARAGEVHALIGENGAGKSTLIKVLTGVYAPDAGELTFNGEPVSFATPSKPSTRASPPSTRRSTSSP